MANNTNKDSKSSASEARLKFLADENIELKKQIDFEESLLKTRADGTEEYIIQLNKLKEIQKALRLNENATKAITRQQSILRNQKKYELDDLNEAQISLTKIGNLVGKNSDLYTKSLERLDKHETVLNSISSTMQSNNITNKKDIHNLEIMQSAFKGHTTSLIKIAELQSQGGTNTKELSDMIVEAGKAYKDVISTLEFTEQGWKSVGEVINSASNEVKSYTNAAKKASENTELIDRAIDSIGSSGIPIMNELVTTIKSVKEGGIGAKLAILALGTAVAGLAGTYFGAGISAEFQAKNDQIQTDIDAAREIGQIKNEFDNRLRRSIIETGQIELDTLKNKIKIDSDFASIGLKRQLDISQNQIDTTNEINRLTIDAGFAAQRAANAFSAEMKSGALAFQAASKTALFGSGIGSVSYNVGQLQLAGIGAETIADQMSAVSTATGQIPTAEFAAKMAIIAKRTGQTSEGVSSINDMFMRMDNTSAEVSLNLQEGMRAMADNAGISLGNLMNEVAAASKEALSYQIRSGKVLAKQVATAQSIGVSFSEVAKAGQSMVLNYKDSIKAEMSLSAMLGKNVDLSEVRAKFAAGDTEGAMAALKAQGLDPTKMDMFQQQALQSATGGMDILSLQKIAQNQPKQIASLTEGKADVKNKQFLQKTQEAQSTLNIGQAQLSAKQAIIDAALSGEITKAYLQSPAYIDYQAALAAQAKKQEDYNSILARSAILKEQDDKKYQDALLKQQTDLATVNAEIQKAFQATKEYITAIKESTQLGITRSFTDNLVPAVSGFIGSAITTFLLTKFGKGMFGGSDPMRVTIVGNEVGGTSGGVVDNIRGLFGEDSASKDTAPNNKKNKSTSKTAVPSTSQKSPKGKRRRGRFNRGKAALGFLQDNIDLAGPVAEMVGVDPDTIETITSLIPQTADIASDVVSSTGGKAAKAATKATGGILKKVGIGALKLGKGLVGKLAWPLTVAQGLYDAYEGFNADASASIGDKFINAGTSALSGLSFGLVGKSAEDIKTQSDSKIGKANSGITPTSGQIAGGAAMVGMMKSMIDTVPGKPTTAPAETDSISILQTIQKNDHVRGISTLNEMKAQTAISNKMATNDHQRGIVMVSQMKSQSAVLAKMLQRETQIMWDNGYQTKQLKNLVVLTENIQALTEATAILTKEMANKYQIASPDIVLDGKRVSKGLGRINDKNRAIVK